MDARVAREEVFGPIAAVISFRDEAEAVALANDTIYGLSGSIWTRDGARALRVARAIETGVLSINSNNSVRVTTPFGGFKQSGYGRELGPHALEAYTEVKTIFYATEGWTTADSEREGTGRLDGRVCVVTGAGGGIGASTVELFATRRGARSSASTCTPRGRRATCRCRLDVAERGQVREMLARCATRFGRIDVLFNNAGISPER